MILYYDINHKSKRLDKLVLHDMSPVKFITCLITLHSAKKMRFASSRI